MFSANIKLFFACALGFCFLVSCGPNQDLKNAWKETKSQYYRYLNTPAVLTLFDTTEHADYAVKLGSAMAKVDEELKQLQRVMDDSDRGLDNNWAAAIFKRFPWLSGIAVLDGAQYVMARMPDYSLKEFKPEQLFDEVPRQRPGDLRAIVLDNPLGPEIYLGKPVYISGELRAMVVAHFDMRALLSHHRSAAEMAVVTPEAILWPGVYDISETPIPTTDWQSLVRRDVSGAVSNEKGKFHWCFSYFANLQLIYAVAESGSFGVYPEQLELLDAADAFAVPSINLAPPTPPMNEPSTTGEALDQ